MVAVPLEMTAAISAQVWWTGPPLAIAIWWWADSVWPWAWILGLEEGLFGAGWSYTGALALGEFPGSRAITATIWIACAAAMAAVAVWNRRSLSSAAAWRR